MSEVIYQSKELIYFGKSNPEPFLEVGAEECEAPEHIWGMTEVPYKDMRREAQQRQRHNFTNLQLNFGGKHALWRWNPEPLKSNSNAFLVGKGHTTSCRCQTKRIHWLFFGKSKHKTKRIKGSKQSIPKHCLLSSGEASYWCWTSPQEGTERITF